MIWPGDLRFHPTCPRGNQQRLPAVVALLRDIRSDKPKAIQRIFLKADGSDRLRDTMGKATLGPAAGCVCKLSRNEDVCLGLGLTEGVEKGLAILNAGWAPIWVSCGTSGMAKFPVLAGIECLTVFADHDAGGQRAATECAQRWADAGKHVRIVTPKIAGFDWNDALREAA
jgi:hypothetical protein